MYHNHFVQFSRLGEQGLGTNGKYIRYASFRFFLQIDTTSIVEDKKNIHSIRSNCAFTKIKAVLIDVYVFNSSSFSSSFFKGAFLLLKSVVWCRRTKTFVKGMSQTLPVCQGYLCVKTSLIVIETGLGQY